MKLLQAVRTAGRGFRCGLMFAGLLACAGERMSWAQLPLGGEQPAAPNPLTDPTVKPGKAFLFDLDARFAKDVRDRGGAAFSDWFAQDGVALNNGQAPLIGLV